MWGDPEHGISDEERAQRKLNSAVRDFIRKPTTGNHFKLEESYRDAVMKGLKHG